MASNMRRRASVAVNRMGQLTVGGKMVQVSEMLKRHNDPHVNTKRSIETIQEESCRTPHLTHKYSGKVSNRE